MEYPRQYQGVESRTSLVQQYIRVFGWMFVGLMVTGAAAYLTISSDLIQLVYNRFALLGLFVAELALVWFLSKRAMGMQYGAAAGVFILYSVLNGVTLSLIFFAYTLGSIAFAFFVTAAFFGFMSVYGAVTKQDLTSMGSLLLMGLIGIIIASIVNWFLHSTALYWFISYAGVVVFLGLTAYDAQKIKSIHAAYAGTPKERNVAIIAALQLYLDFINLFLYILRILGKKK